MPERLPSPASTGLGERTGLCWMRGHCHRDPLAREFGDNTGAPVSPALTSGSWVPQTEMPSQDIAGASTRCLANGLPGSSPPWLAARPGRCAASLIRDRREIGGATAVGYFRARSLTEGGYVAWVLRLVEIGAEGEGSCADVVEISRPDGLVDIANLGLTLAEAKLVLAGIQREIVAAQARDHAVRRPRCRRCAGVCRVKDYRRHAIATLFGQGDCREIGGHAALAAGGCGSLAAWKRCPKPV